MANIVPFGQDLPVPAHVAKFVTAHSNIDERATVPQLSFRGKVWRMVVDGDETILMKDDEPISMVSVVVLDHNKARSRAYYEGAFEDGKSQPPACWSSDGVKPDVSVKEKQGESCAACPQSVKGSKVTPNGKSVTACSVFKRVAIAPLAEVGAVVMEKMQPEGMHKLLLKLAQTSVWDKNNEDQEAKGWYAWDQYLDMLRTRGATHTGVVATKVKFDPRVPYPKLLFSATRWLTEDELTVVTPLFTDESVTKLLKAPEPAVAARKEPDADDDDDAVVAVAAPANAPAPKPAAAKPKAAAPPDDDDAPPAKPAKVAKAKAAAPPDDDDDAPPAKPVKAKAKVVESADEDDAPPAKPNGKAKAAAPPDDDAPPVKSPKTTGTGAGLGDLLDEWDA